MNADSQLTNNVFFVFKVPLDNVVKRLSCLSVLAIVAQCVACLICIQKFIQI